jgi:hypothetical protein
LDEPNVLELIEVLQSRGFFVDAFEEIQKNIKGIFRRVQIKIYVSLSNELKEQLYKKLKLDEFVNDKFIIRLFSEHGKKYFTTEPDELMISNVAECLCISIFESEKIVKDMCNEIQKIVMRKED